MTSPRPPRHLLVIAPQCPALGLLDGLEDVARSLHTALLDPAVGGCEDAPSGLSSLLCGPDVTRAQVDEAVREAAVRAGEAGAVLVLAFVGHGTTPGDAPRLCFMAGDSQEDAPATVVDVGALLAVAADTPGVHGVVALVDTCRAGGAVPDLAALGAGVRGGAIRLSLLMSVGVGEDAYGLAFSRGVVRVLREGVPGAGEFLSAPDVGSAADLVAGTNAHAVTAQGGSIGAPVWLARNARYTPGGGALLGPLGERQLRWALEPLGAAVPPPLLSTPAELKRLGDTLRELGRGAAAEAAHVLCALRVTDGLTDAVRTMALLLDWPGAPLTSPRIRRAFTVAADGAVRAPESGGGELLRDCVESLRLLAPRAGGSRTAPLAAFVAALAVEDQLSATTPQLVAWATGVGAVVELNDAFARCAARSAEGRLRLVVSLHAAVAEDWPETLLAWLLDGGRYVTHQEFPCAPHKAGVEQELTAVLMWATDQARAAGGRLRHIDIAAPAALLASWRPEEAQRVGPRLGLRHDVVLRWSDRLQPPAHLWWINEHARDQLDAPRACTGPPVDWLGADETSRTDVLQDQLAKGVYDRAVALDHRPGRLVDVLEHLLAYTPIVLWPHSPDDLPAASRESVERHWDRMPGELSAAYRSVWRATGGRPEQDGGHEDLARLRSAWHDTEWLDFCDWFETR